MLQGITMFAHYILTHLKRVPVNFWSINFL